ncbi:MAG: hypothetical protein CMJ58_17365 [Planctomycetaceae bacterium]|nr:hypothetical protein [Planctomycetaceae bacterium]
MLGINGLIPRAYLDSGALTTDQKAIIGEAIADYGKHAAALRKEGTSLAQYCETVCRDAGFELPDDTRASLDRQQDRHGGVLVNGLHC